MTWLDTVRAALDNAETCSDPVLRIALLEDARMYLCKAQDAIRAQQLEAA